MSHSGPPSPIQSKLKPDDVVLLVVNWLKEQKYTSTLDALRSECPAAGLAAPSSYKSLNVILSEYVALSTAERRRKMFLQNPSSSAMLSGTVKKLETLLEDYMTFRTQFTPALPTSSPSSPRLSPRASPRGVTPPTSSLSTSTIPFAPFQAPIIQTSEASSPPPPQPPLSPNSPFSIHLNFPSKPSASPTQTKRQKSTLQQPQPRQPTHTQTQTQVPTQTQTRTSTQTQTRTQTLTQAQTQAQTQTPSQTQAHTAQDEGMPSTKKRSPTHPADDNPVKKRLKFENEYDNMGILLESTELLLEDPSLQEKLASTINQHLLNGSSGLQDGTLNAILDSFLDDPTVENIFTSPEKRPHRAHSSPIPSKSISPSHSALSSSTPLYSSPNFKHSLSSDNLSPYMKYPPFSPNRGSTLSSLGINEIKSPKRKAKRRLNSDDGLEGTEHSQPLKQAGEFPNTQARTPTETKQIELNESEIDKFLNRLSYG